MIRSVVLVELRADCDRTAVAEVQDGFRALEPAGCVSYTLGDDLGLREGNWSFAIVADFLDEASYREYDGDAEHNRLRAALAAQTEQIARAQFEFAG